MQNMFDTSDVCIKLDKTKSNKPPHNPNQKKLVIYSVEYDNLVGLVFKTLQFTSAHLYHREWRGVLNNEETIIVVISANIVSIGTGSSEIEAAVTLKPVGVLDSLASDISDIIEALHWKVPVCCCESID